MRLKYLYEKYMDVMPYFFFGVCTTGVNVVMYWLFAHIIKVEIMLSTIIAWFFAVLFAYITNRRWVFHSKAKERSAVYKEIISFFGCRLATGVIDCLCMFLFVNMLLWDDTIVKLTINIFVIFFNYITSKLIIFKSNDIDHEY